MYVARCKACLRFGERKFSETYSQAVEATGLSKYHLQYAMYVSKAYETSAREENLSWTHHREAASLESDTRRDAPATALVEGLSTRQHLLDLLCSVFPNRRILHVGLQSH